MARIKKVNNHGKVRLVNGLDAKFNEFTDGIPGRKDKATLNY